MQKLKYPSANSVRSRRYIQKDTAALFSIYKVLDLMTFSPPLLQGLQILHWSYNREKGPYKKRWYAQWLTVAAFAWP